MHKELEWFENVFRFLFLISCCTKGCLHKKRSYYFKWPVPPVSPIAPLPHLLSLNLHKWAMFSRFVFNISKRNRTFMIFWRQFEIGRHPPHPWSREDKYERFFFQILYPGGEPVFRWTAYKRFFLGPKISKRWTAYKLKMVGNELFKRYS